MALDQTANFVRQGVASSVGSGDTSISVSDASAFPDPSSGEYNLVLWDTDQGRPDQDSNVEVVRVTGRDTGTDELTVTRAQESTSAVSHPATSALTLSPTAKMFGDIQTRTSGFNDAGTSLDVDDMDIGGSDFAANGEVVYRPSWGPLVQRTLSTTNQTYTGNANWWAYNIRWNDLLPSGDLSLFVAISRFDTMDVRLQNTSDGVTVFEDTGSSANISESTSFTPNAPANVRAYQWQIRSPEGTSVEAGTPYLAAGLQL